MGFNLNGTGKTMAHNGSNQPTLIHTGISRPDTLGTAISAVRARRARPAAFCRLALLSLLALGLGAARVDAAPEPLDAKVVWAGDEHAIIAGDTSLSLHWGDRVEFVRNDAFVVASGAIERIIDPEVAIVRLLGDSSGSLKWVKKLDRLRLRVDRLTLQAPAVLRLGYPTDGRANLLFACGRMKLSLPGPVHAYRAEEPADHLIRLIRDPMATPSGTSLPDTLIVRLFDESADEEIAFELGELDVAVFWPGELSNGVRERMSRLGFMVRVPARGFMCAIWLAPDDSANSGIPDWYGLRKADQNLFGGDLFSPEYLRGPQRPPSRQCAVRWEVDHACPGWQTFEMTLNRPPGERPTDACTDRIWIFRVDAPPGDPSAIAQAIADRVRTGPVSAASRARADSLVAEIRAARYEPFHGTPLSRIDERLGVTWFFAPRTAVLCWGRLKPYLEAVGTESLVNLLDCAPAGH